MNKLVLIFMPVPLSSNKATKRYRIKRVCKICSVKVYKGEKCKCIMNTMSDVDISELYISLKKKKSEIKNKGDKGEIILLLDIYYWNYTKQYNKLITIFGNEAEEGITLMDISSNTIINDINTIQKAKGIFKADCIIKMNKTNTIYRISIKCKNGGVPSVMNHQRRDQPVFQPGGDLNYLLLGIDMLVSKYHDLRKDGLPEEVNFAKLHNFSSEDNEVLLELVCYFMFNGSGNNTSKQMADSLLIIDGTDINFVNLNGKENQMKYIKDNWNLFNISLISRKNLGSIKFKDEIQRKCNKDNKFKQKYELMKPWIYETTDNGKNNPENKIKLKTALHIRMK